MAEGVLMRKLALVAFLASAGALAACSSSDDDDDVNVGDDDDGDDEPGVDAGPDPVACDPVAQTGCAAEEKCTWLVEQVDPDYLARSACVPNGATAIGAACTSGEMMPGAESGYDDC